MDGTLQVRRVFEVFPDLAQFAKFDGVAVCDVAKLFGSASGKKIITALKAISADASSQPSLVWCVGDEVGDKFHSLFSGRWNMLQSVTDECGLPLQAAMEDSLAGLSELFKFNPDDINSDAILQDTDSFLASFTQNDAAHMKTKSKSFASQFDDLISLSIVSEAFADIVSRATTASAIAKLHATRFALARVLSRPAMWVDSEVGTNFRKLVTDIYDEEFASGKVFSRFKASLEPVMADIAALAKKGKNKSPEAAAPATAAAAASAPAAKASGSGTVGRGGRGGSRGQSASAKAKAKAKAKALAKASAGPPAPIADAAVEKEDLADAAADETNLAAGDEVDLTAGDEVDFASSGLELETALADIIDRDARAKAASEDIDDDA